MLTVLANQRIVSKGFIIKLNSRAHSSNIYSCFALMFGRMRNPFPKTGIISQGYRKGGRGYILINLEAECPLLLWSGNQLCIFPIPVPFQIPPLLSLCGLMHSNTHIRTQSKSCFILLSLQHCSISSSYCTLFSWPGKGQEC